MPENERHGVIAAAPPTGSVPFSYGDAMVWLRDPHPDATPPGGLDAVIVDLPDPDTPVLGRLYSTEFYALITRALAPRGLLVVQTGSPYSTPTLFWRAVCTIASAGYAVTPYHVYVPTFGDWGFVLARRATSRRRPKYRRTHLRCVSSTSQCSTPPPCSRPTWRPAPLNPPPSSIRASSTISARDTGKPVHRPPRPSPPCLNGTDHHRHHHSW